MPILVLGPASSRYLPSFRKSTERANFVRSLNLPGNGIFALRADTFQQYFQASGWVA